MSLKDMKRDAKKATKKFKSASEMMQETAEKLGGKTQDVTKGTSSAMDALKAQAGKLATARKASESTPAVSYVGTHTVAAGDSMSQIAVKYYGSGTKDKWMAIYNANKAVIGDNPSAIVPGQELKIPKL